MLRQLCIHTGVLIFVYHLSQLRRWLCETRRLSVCPLVCLITGIYKLADGLAEIFEKG